MNKYMDVLETATVLEQIHNKFAGTYEQLINFLIYFY